MTRVNLVDPIDLTDQHLIAEIREINQLGGQFKKSLFSKNGIKEIPIELNLGNGYISFFFDKGKYLQHRFYQLKEEAIIRGFNIKVEFNNEWSKCDALNYFNDWSPTLRDIQILRGRISAKTLKKPNFYRYYRKKIDNVILFLEEKNYI